jgi:imidazolonepropionase-like amidohydrolase
VTKTLKLALCAAALAFAGARVFHAQTPGAATAVAYEGARLIIGDTSSPITAGTMVVQGGRITAIGPSGQVTVPAGAARVNLTGKTVMPAMNNVHIHIGYEGFTSWSAQNHTVANVLDHLQREAFYGVGAAMTMGDQPSDWAIQFQRDQAAGKFSPAARFFFAAGMAPPGGGPDSLLIQGTTPLKAVYEVATPDQARAAVATIAGKKIEQIKIWVDDRDATRGSKQRMPVPVITAIVEEAHKRSITVHAHATTLANQKDVVRAGVDVLVHTVVAEKLDAEFMTLLQEKKPYWAPVMGLSDRPGICHDDSRFLDQTLPAKAIADIREGRNAFNMPGCQAPATPAEATREDNLRYNFPRMLQSGARLVLSTDAGVLPKYSFGSSEHQEMEMYVKLGATPAAAIVAATSTAAQVIRAADAGALVVGKRADFIVLNTNPLENIRNTRQIDSVYLNGTRLDRDKWLASWEKAGSEN